MELKLTITGASGEIKASADGTDLVRLVYHTAYQPGDTLHLESDVPGFVWAKMEDSIPETMVWLAAPYHLNIPFGEKRENYSPKSFIGEKHLLQVRAASEREIGGWRNLALNPLDHSENIGLFPHARANIETRGESVFAARNAIDGCYANDSHGQWPYQSWGINRDPNAEFRLDFGRTVLVDELRLTLRADFPHDSWWEEAVVEFSDGSIETLHLRKAATPQQFPVESRKVEWLVLKSLKKAPDSSPFPALTQLEVYGTEIL